MSTTPSNQFTTSPRSTTLIYTRDALTTEEVVQKWHDDTHPDPWKFCMLQPCHAIHELSQGVVTQGGLHR
jgi:hypothetical protein